VLTFISEMILKWLERRYTVGRRPAGT
jgi:hypothetical protein